MTEDINDYSFNFARETTDIRRKLGAGADTLTFINASQPRNIQGLQSILQENNPGKRTRSLIRGRQITDKDILLACETAVGRFTKNPRAGTAAVRLNEDGEQHYAILLNKNSFDKNTMGKEYEELARLFSFYHETAHGLITGGDKVDALHPFRECAADACATLFLLQRFGQHAAPFLSAYSWSRSFNALLGDTAHLTTAVIDRILADSTAPDFAELSVEETIGLAREYAEQWTPDATAISAASDFLLPAAKTRNEAATLTDVLITTCLSPNSSDLAFVTGAKAVQGFLLPEGVLVNGAPVQFTAENREFFSTVINTRLSKMNITSLFNAAGVSQKTVSAAALIQPLIPPPNRKPLIFNAGIT